MLACLRWIIPILPACALLLPPLSSRGEGLSVDKGNSSARLEFRIVIPRVIHVLENSHPTLLDPEHNGDWSALQLLVVETNMKRGFCATLSMSTPEVRSWSVSTPKNGDITLTAVHDGYRVCMPRPGRYTLMLQHSFEATAHRPPNGVLRWPVKTDIVAF